MWTKRGQLHDSDRQGNGRKWSDSHPRVTAAGGSEQQMDTLKSQRGVENSKGLSRAAVNLRRPQDIFQLLKLFNDVSKQRDLRLSVGPTMSPMAAAQESETPSLHEGLALFDCPTI